VGQSEDKKRKKEKRRKKEGKNGTGPILFGTSFAPLLV
jgi:hypothetical protein